MRLIGALFKLVWFITFGWILWLLALPFRKSAPAPATVAAGGGVVAYEYKTVVLDSVPGFDVSAKKIAQTANKLAKDGWELVNQSQSQTTGLLAQVTMTLTFRRAKR